MVLGARIFIDLGAKSVAARLEEAEAELWRADLLATLGDNWCDRDLAATFAGRLGVACSFARGRVGRAFVRAFHAQANAPLSETDCL